MKTLATAMGCACALSAATPALAGGIERLPQCLNILFEKGNYAEVPLGAVSPSVTGTDAGTGRATGDVAASLAFIGMGYKQQLNDRLSAALIA